MTGHAFTEAQSAAILRVLELREFPMEYERQGIEKLREAVRPGIATMIHEDWVAVLYSLITTALEDLPDAFTMQESLVLEGVIKKLLPDIKKSQYWTDKKRG